LSDLGDEMRLLVTGGAGFIGSNFVRRVLQNESSAISSIIVLDKLTYAGVRGNLSTLDNDPRFRFVMGDIRNQGLVIDLLAQSDAVINFAAESHVDRSILNAADFVETNVLGVQVLLDAIRMSRRDIRFLQVSTDEVYGSIEKGSWDENCPLLPNSPYAASKAGGELLSRAYHRTHGLDVVITRSSNNYGTHHFPEKLIPLFITNLLEGKKVTVYGKGKNIRDWLHVDDHCEGVYQALTKGKSGEVYNIGGGRELSNIEITQFILAEMGSDMTSVEFVTDRKGHDFRYSINWKKINEELGYLPKVKFEDGLRETIKWYRENESWWKPLKAR
jgi:dTDP-glucose 4,6-dehydratase